MNIKKYIKKRGDRTIKNREEPRVRPEKPPKNRKKGGLQRIKVKLIKKDVDEWTSLQMKKEVQQTGGKMD
jgi:hypothetical protein